MLRNVSLDIFPGTQGGPLMHTIAGKAVCFKEAMSDGFKAYQKQIVAILIAATAVVLMAYACTSFAGRTADQEAEPAAAHPENDPDRVTFVAVGDITVDRKSTRLNSSH